MAASGMSFATLHQLQQQQQQPVIRIMRNPTFIDTRQPRRQQVHQVQRRLQQSTSITASRHAALLQQAQTPRATQPLPPANQQQSQLPPMQIPMSFPHLYHLPQRFNSDRSAADAMWTSTEPQIRKRFQLNRESTGLTATFKSQEHKTQLTDVQHLPANSSYAALPTSTSTSTSRWATKQNNDRRLAVALESVDEEQSKAVDKQKFWNTLTCKGSSKNVETPRDPEVHRAPPDGKDSKLVNDMSGRRQRQWDATDAGKLNLMTTHLVSGNEVNRKLLRRRSKKKLLGKIRVSDVFPTDAAKLKATSITGSSEDNSRDEAKRTGIGKDNCKKEMTNKGRELEQSINFAEEGPEITVTDVRHSNDVIVSAAGYDELRASGETNGTKEGKHASDNQVQTSAGRLPVAHQATGIRQVFFGGGSSTGSCSADTSATSGDMLLHSPTDVTLPALESPEANDGRRALPVTIAVGSNRQIPVNDELITNSNDRNRKSAQHPVKEPQRLFQTTDQNPTATKNRTQPNAELESQKQIDSYRVIRQQPAIKFRQPVTSRLQTLRCTTPVREKIRQFKQLHELHRLERLHQLRSTVPSNAVLSATPAGGAAVVCQDATAADDRLKSLAATQQGNSCAVRKISLTTSWRTWRDVNHSDVYNDVEKYISENNLMPNDKRERIAAWIEASCQAMKARSGVELRRRSSLTREQIDKIIERNTTTTDGDDVLSVDVSRVDHCPA